MAKLGFKPGEGLGRRAGPENAAGENGKEAKSGRSEPLNLVFKEDRAGIGLDSERKRKLREEAEEVVKKAKVEEGDYRDRVRAERETRRVEGQIYGAQKVAEKLDLEAEGEDVEKEEKNGGVEEGEGEDENEDGRRKEPTRKKAKPTNKINVLYRGMVREREDREKSILARHALHTSLPSSFFPNPRLPGFEDGSMEKEDRQALGTKREDPATLLEQELEEEDPELDEFNALEPADRLMKLVMYLRETYGYCFWCKYRYTDSEELEEACPGVTEEDHD